MGLSGTTVSFASQISKSLQPSLSVIFSDPDCECILAIEAGCLSDEGILGRRMHDGLLLTALMFRESRTKFSLIDQVRFHVTLLIN